jgi:hypothetical protein
MLWGGPSQAGGLTTMARATPSGGLAVRRSSLPHGRRGRMPWGEYLLWLSLPLRTAGAWSARTPLPRITEMARELAERAKAAQGG